MQCRNHAGVAATERCSACAESFCNDCLVEVLGQKYCASCKVITAKTPPPLDDGDTPCETANKALAYSIVGIFCLGVVFGPMAISKGLEARREIRADPSLAGLAKANIGVVLGAVVLILWGLGMASKFKQ